MQKQIFLFVMTVFLFGYGIKAQDYIIAWNNDTIYCELPGDAKKAGLKPFRRYEDGYEKIMAVFNKDSLRIVSAGEIKGYKREKHGKRLLCNGFFEARKMSITTKDKRTIVDGKDVNKIPEWFFYSRIVDGKYATLFIRYIDDGRCTFPSYYLYRPGIDTENTVVSFISKKKLVEMLSDGDIASEMKAFEYRKSKRGFTEIVREYNRLKEAAAQK